MSAITCRAEGSSSCPDDDAPRPRRHGRPLLFGLVLSVALVAGACSDASITPSTSSTTPPNVRPHRTTTTTVTPTTASSSGSGSSPIYEVKVGTVSGLGKVLTDGAGMTLYMFVPDKQSGHSTCYSACASGWPALVLPKGVTTPIAGPGVSTALLATSSRTDGTVQLTYNRWPLYLWVGDSEPGQATGQGLNNLGGLWYVLNPSGQVVKTAP